MLRVQLSADDYLFSHGKEPRGYGKWCFRLRWSDGRAADISVTGSYAESKARATATARQQGAWQVEVLG